jgi:hypothetical protein
VPRPSEAPQPQAVGDHEHARERHGRAGDHRVEEPGGGERERGDVVGEGPEQVALDRGEGAAGQADGVGGGAQVAADQGEVGCLDGDVGAGAHREAEVGLGERGGVVDAVADHGHDPALVLQSADDVDLVLGQDLGDDVVDADLGGDGRAARSLSPVSSTGRRPSARSSAIASAEVSLTVSATTRTPRAAPSQATTTRCGPRLGGRAPRAEASGSDRPLSASSAAAGDDGVAVDDALHAEALGVGEGLDRRQLDPSSIRDRGGDGRSDRVLGGVLERAGEAQHSSSSVPAVGGHDRRRRAPSGRW